MNCKLSDIDVLFKKIKKNKPYGLLYWCINYWKNNIDHKTQNNFFNERYWNSNSLYDVNGAGLLVYPGENGDLYPSIRLLKIRDGIESVDFSN